MIIALFVSMIGCERTEAEPEEEQPEMAVYPGKAPSGSRFVAMIRGKDINWLEVDKVYVGTNAKATLCDNFTVLYDGVVIGVNIDEDAAEAIDIIVEYSDGELVEIDDGIVIDNTSELDGAERYNTICNDDCNIKE